MLQSKLILSNAVAIWGCRLLLVLPQLILTPFLLNVIGEDGYGIFVLVWSLFLAIDQLEVSLQSGVIKYSAGLLASGRRNEVNRLLSTSLMYSLAVAVVAVAAISAVSRYWSVEGHDLTIAWFGVGGISFLMVLATPYVGIVKACQRHYIEVIAETLFRMLGVLLIWGWLTWISPSLSAAILISAVMLLLSRLIQVPVALNLVPGLQFSPTLVDLATLRLLLKFGAAAVVVALCSIANDAGLRWLMVFFQGPGFVAHLAVMLIPGAVLMQFARALTVTVLPASSALAASGDGSRLQDLLVRGMRYTTVIACCGFLAAQFLLEDAFRIWLGRDYQFLVPHTLGVITAVSIRMSAMIARPILMGVGRLRPAVSIAILADAVVPLSVVGVLCLFESDPYFTVTTGLIAGNLLWALLCCGYAAHAIRLRLIDIAARIYGPNLLATLVAWMFGWVLLTVSANESLVVRLVVFGLVCGVFLLQAMWLYVSKSERNLHRDWIKSTFSNLYMALFKSTR